SAATVLPIQSMIKASGYEQTFLYFGLGQGLIVVILSLFLARPNADAIAQLPKSQANVEGRRQFKPMEILATPTFWLMYFMFILMAAGGLFVTANLKQIAEDFKVSDVPVSFIGVTMTAVTFAAFLDRILNGITRPFFGWVSDKIGREQTMFLAFTAEGIGIL